MLLLKFVKILEASNHEIVDTIVGQAYDAIAHSDIHLGSQATPGDRSPDAIGVSKACMEVSGIVTRTAHELGVVASREVHFGHALTSFAPIEKLPAGEDLILCLTWGQFNPDKYHERSERYFGRRSDIAALVGGFYASRYAPRSTEQRQITYAYDTPLQLGHLWLATTPVDLLIGDYPLGGVPYDRFPPGEWE